MRGYKGTNKDLKCRGFQFEIGKTYEVYGDVKLCDNGFHFCEKLLDVFDYYEHGKDNRYFEVEADGDILKDGTKSVARTIRLIREISPVEVNRAKYGNGHGYGDGYGNVYGNGYGYGYGYGYGNGRGNGNGNGSGYGNGINKIAQFKEEQK